MASPRVSRASRSAHPPLPHVPCHLHLVSSAPLSTGLKQPRERHPVPQCVRHLWHGDREGFTLIRPRCSHSGAHVLDLGPGTGPTARLSARLLRIEPEPLIGQRSDPIRERTGWR